MEAAVADLKAQVEAMRLEVTEARTRQAQAEAAILAQNQVIGAQRAPQLVDTRVFGGKVSNFSGQHAEWADWKFAFQIFMTAANNAAGALMDWAAQQKGPIIPETVDQQDAIVPGARALDK